MVARQWFFIASLNRRSYLAWGLALFLVKFVVDRTAATLAFGRGWSPLDYFVPSQTLGLLFMPPAERAFYGTMVAITLPFVLVGTGMTLARLRDAGMSPWLMLLFFVLVANLFLFATLCIVPSRLKQEEAIPTPVIPLSQESGEAPVLSYGIDPEKPIWKTMSRFFPAGPGASAALAVLVSTTLLVLFIFLGVHVLEGYGWGLFIGAPFALGMMSAIMHGLGTPRTLGECMGVAMLASFVGLAAVFMLAMEGMGCIIMALPLMLPLAAMGAWVGYGVQSRPTPPSSAVSLLVTLTMLMPALLGAESIARLDAPLYEVTTVVEVDAPPQRVWENVVDFPSLPPPNDWLFRAGVAYPVRADITGKGKGAIRECVFSTGAFIEPIEIWDEPNLLKFSVTSNPPAMKEWTFYKNVHPPHVDNFLISRGGQFKLIPLPGGRTRLEGTTWYHHDLWPAAYWRWWSDFIIHRIHGRVLNHVKVLSESETTPLEQF